MLAFSSASYWEARYSGGGTSGAGSYGQLARFKAAFVNGFTHLNAVGSVLDLGCGDGNQLGLLDLPGYTGVDVSPSSLAQCRATFGSRPHHSFVHADDLGGVPRHELALSLDVIYHLVEDAVFQAYLDTLFTKATRFVVTYSSNVEAEWSSVHVRHRRFTDAAARRHPAWRLAAHVPNLFPFRADAPNQTSFADFFVFAAPGEGCVVPCPG